MSANTLTWNLDSFTIEKEEIIKDKEYLEIINYYYNVVKKTRGIIFFCLLGRNAFPFWMNEKGQFVGIGTKAIVRIDFNTLKKIGWIKKIDRHTILTSMSYNLVGSSISLLMKTVKETGKVDLSPLGAYMLVSALPNISALGAFLSRNPTSDPEELSKGYLNIVVNSFKRAMTDIPDFNPKNELPIPELNFLSPEDIDVNFGIKKLSEGVLYPLTDFGNLDNAVYERYKDKDDVFIYQLEEPEVEEGKKVFKPIMHTSKNAYEDLEHLTIKNGDLVKMPESDAYYQAIYDTVIDDEDGFKILKQFIPIFRKI